jgi:hypothetical protein
MVNDELHIGFDEMGLEMETQARVRVKQVSRNPRHTHLIKTAWTQFNLLQDIGSIDQFVYFSVMSY